MKIFPKCLVNRAPQITYDGYVLPCCWIPYTDNLEYYVNGNLIKDKNMFMRKDFNLYNNKLSDILNSVDWEENLNKVFETTPSKCIEKCDKFYIDNGYMGTQNVQVPKFNPLNTNKEENIASIVRDKDIYEKSKKRFHGIREKLQLETTSRCTLKCPYCTRTKEAKKGTYLKSDLSLDIMHDVLNYTNWRKIDDCGRYGDPVFYKYFLEMLDILKDSNVENYRIHTAATGRGIHWWKQAIDKIVASNNNGTKIEITFGIDGLEQTSKIHRINQDWQEITRSMQMCNEAGIKTVWQFIPFKQNEHEIEQVKKLAKEWNIELRFVLSNRFKGFDDPMIPTNASLHNYTG